MYVLYLLCVSPCLCVYTVVCVHVRVCIDTSAHTNPYLILYIMFMYIIYICTYQILVQYILDSAIMIEINGPPPDSNPLNIALAFLCNFPPFPPCTSIIRPKAVARMTSIVILLYKLQLDTDTYNCC